MSPAPPQTDGNGKSRHWQRYPAYKPSGVEWLGDVPEGWKKVRLRFLCSITTGSKNTEDSEPSGLYPFFVRSDIVERLNTYSFDEEAILTAGDGAIAKVFHHYKGKFDVHQRVYVLTRFKEVLGSFLFYYFSQNLADEVVKLSAKSTVDSLRMPMLQNFPVLVPSQQEQTAIAAFLDRETARIDALIEKKERQIALLQEKRAALISHAVTKGLDPSVPMKDSGVEWLGMVPEHWDVSRIKWVAKLDSGHTPNKQTEGYWTDCTIPWVSLNDTSYLKNHDYIKETAQQISELGMANSSAHLLPPRVVIFTRDATIGLAAITTRPMAVSQHIIAWICGPKMLPEYLLFAFYSMTQDLERLTMGSTIKTIGMSDVFELTTPLPPMEEQQKISDYIFDQKEKIDYGTGKIQESIDLLREYRSALISAAVNGKIDVRQEAKA